MDNTKIRNIRNVSELNFSGVVVEEGGKRNGDTGSGLGSRVTWDTGYGIRLHGKGTTV